ncbi:MAG: hypothetical protein A2252_03910 [Elusimicrobia bacterium RIFOXYA2_FULL_39_19]|nr:MAG: hypothetical protein A2252_03910 [Elusimicrobia bacterium RIFOXYA2_FULL_39_19]
MCLGADVARGENQKPFDSKIDYTHLMWIDSDILFSPAQFQALLDHDKDIISGIYAMQDGKSFATVKDWDEEYFKQNGSFRFLTVEDITRLASPDGVSSGEKQKLPDSNLIEVAYTGFGFMLIKKGVFESMTYPWFKPIEKKIGEIIDYTGRYPDVNW